MPLPRKTFASVLNVAAVAADTGYVLVDLSDTTNYPHLTTAEIHLLGLLLHAEKATDGDFNLTVGVVIENDATNGSIKGVYQFNMSHVANATDSTDRLAPVYVDFTLGGAIPEGVNLNVTSGAVTYFVSNVDDADNTIWQNDVGLLSPVGAAAGATGKPGAGDLVVLVEENAGAGTLDFCITAIYSTA
jgi:hypothetical protein